LFNKYYIGTGTNKPGLFGHCEAHYGMTEIQGGGILHLHALLWIKGAPKTTTETLEQLNNVNLSELFKQNVLQYTKQIVSNNLPESFTNTGCDCGATYNQLQPLKRKLEMLRPKFTYHKNTDIKEPTLIQCLVCESKFSPQHLLRKWIINSFPDAWPPISPNVSEDVNEIEKRKLNASQLIKMFKNNDELIKGYVSDANDILKCNDFYLRMMTMPLSEDEMNYDDKIKNLILAYLVITNNQHWYYHCPSCVKGGKTNCYCRYGFPKLFNVIAAILRDEILLERNIGHEYINGFNDVLMRVFKCNHDIKVMVGGTEMAERIYYCCKYITKQQNSIESNAAIQLAFEKREVKEQQKEELPGDKKSKHRVGAMVISLSSGRMEIAGTLCAFYIFHKTPAYRSHEYKYIYLYEFLKWLTLSDNADYQFDMNMDENTNYVVNRYIDDYLYRPEALTKISIYRFYSSYFRKTIPKDLEKVNKLLFLPQHPLAKSHCLGKHSSPRIPVIYNKIPFYDKCISEPSKDRHAQLTLLLFKPFRNFEDLKTDNLTWDECFHDWKDSTDSYSLQIYNNMQDYFIGRLQASETQKNRFVYY
jgi:hypothetical protein